MLKRVILIWSLCLLLIPSVLAQDAFTNSITSLEGLTVQYPDHYYSESDSDVSIALVDLEKGTIIVFGLGDDVVEFVGEETVSSAEAKDNFLDTLTQLGGSTSEEPIEEFSINDRPAFLVPFEQSFIGTGYVITLELPDGTVVAGMLFGTEETSITPETATELKAIASTITYDSTMAVEAEEEVTDEITDNVEAETEIESDIPSTAILLEDMPEGMILTDDGLQMPMPEGFIFPPGTEYVENSVGLFSEDFLNTMIIYQESMENLGGMGMITQFLLPTLAAIGGHEDFNADEHMQTLEVDGRTITYYASPDFVEVEEGIGGVYYFIVELVPEGDAVALVQATIGTLEVDEAESILFDLVRNITLTEEASAEAEALAITSAIDESATVTCSSTSEEVVSMETPTATVFCPTACGTGNGAIWGTEIYTSDSSICNAAIHMGVIDSMGGEVVVTYVEGQSAYVSTKQNGITSEAYDEWDASFSVSAPEEESE